MVLVSPYSTPILHALCQRNDHTKKSDRIYMFQFIDLFGAIERVPFSGLYDGRDDFWVSGMNTGERAPGLILESGSAGLLEAIDPLVSGLTADAVVPAEFGEAEESVQVIVDEAVSFVHGTCLLPGHRAPPLEGPDCNPCPLTNVLPMCVERTHSAS